MYIDLSPMLSTCRPFNILLGGRGIGKTYGLQKWLIKQCLKSGKEIIYLVRNKVDFYNDGLRASWSKVLTREYPELSWRSENQLIEIEGDSGDYVPLIRGFALTQVQELKRKPFENVDFLFFDEFLIDYTSCSSYVRGNNEPDIILSLYDSIDRNENRLRLFMCGNNDFAYTPYSIHKSFSHPVLPPNGRYLTQHLCVINFGRPADLERAIKNNALNVITLGTRYNDYAYKGMGRSSPQIYGHVDGKPAWCLQIDDTVYGLYKRNGNFIFAKVKGFAPNLCVSSIDAVEGGKTRLLQDQQIKALKRLDGAGRLYYDTQLTLEIIREVLY